ncbi:hypothetical protein [Rhizobium tumorigenes]|uniref:Uncharacterized protein n=1 Tax=Rhizobium tumorigenes TaxID=2041385 RepID=A0AAF1KT23_9HYPH|nr:hypothetical protein [Rhizobium tumorigenes]WFR98721.1 hypothetical protein PR017_23765 [Rhizobium tumorigenes]
MANGPIIEHDPDEPKKAFKPVSWWLLLAIGAFIWVGLIISGQFSWYSVCVGLFTGSMIATWAIEITGNKIPGWWKSKSTPRNSDGDF